MERPSRPTVLRDFLTQARNLLGAIYEYLYAPGQLMAGEIAPEGFASRVREIHAFAADLAPVLYTAARFLGLPSDPTPLIQMYSTETLCLEDRAKRGISGDAMTRAAEALIALIADAEALDAQQAAESKPGIGMTWQAAMRAAESHCARNPFPGVNALAKLVGCSPSTMSKAIDHSASLRARLAEHEAQRRSVSAGAMTKRVAESARQTREPDPVDAAAASTDDLFRRLLEQATPSERARLNAMTPAQRRELVATYAHDPEAHPRVRGRSR